MIATQVDIHSDLVIVDFSLGLASAVVTRLFADTGAAIRRVEPQSGDPSYRSYSAYPAWQKGKQVSTAGTIEIAVASVADVLANAAVCVVGGEDYPDLDWRPDVEALSRAYPGLVILEIGGSAHANAARLPAVEVLAQAYSGLVFEQYSDRPMLYAMPACSYGAALQGLVGVLAALCEKERDGKGQIVRTSLQEGAMSWLPAVWIHSERHDPQIDFVIPKDVQPLIMRCKDGDYIHFSLGTANARLHVYNILGIEDPTLEQDPRGMPSPARGARNFFADFDLLQQYVEKWRREDLLEKLWEFGIPADALNAPGVAWGDEQVAHNGTLVREADGLRRVGPPFRAALADVAGPVVRAPFPGTEGIAGKPPLHGVRVVDMGVFTAGPHASMLLADLGADVIKVEPPSGEPMRASFRQITASSRGKRGLAVDMKSPKGLEIMLRLFASADMVHHNFRPGVAERLGIDANTLRTLNPGLIVLENSGYGKSGPKAQRAGLDMILKALCGHEHYAAGAGNPPVCYRPTTVDLAAGMIGAVASLIAYRVKLKSGTGSAIETSLLDTALFMMSELVQGADGAFLPLPQLNAEQTGFHPAEQLYATRDGWIALAARTDTMVRDLLEVLGLRDVIHKPRQQWAGAEAEILAKALLEWDSAPLRAALDAKAIWNVPCRADAERLTLHDKALQRAKTIACSDNSRYGELLQIGSLYCLSRSPLSVKGDPPTVGQHTRDVLFELGYNDKQIAALFDEGVVA